MKNITPESILQKIEKDFEQSQDWLICLKKYEKRLTKAENDSSKGTLLKEDFERFYDLGYAFFIYQLIEKKVSINEFQEVVKKIYEIMLKEDQNIGFMLNKFLTNEFNDYIDRHDINYQAFFQMTEIFLIKNEEFGEAQLKTENFAYLSTLLNTLPLPQKSNKGKLTRWIKMSKITEFIAEFHNDVSQLTPIFEIALAHPIFQPSTEEVYDFWKDSVEKIIFNIDRDNDIEKNKRTYELFLNNNKLQKALLDLMENHDNVNNRVLEFCGQSRIDFFPVLNQIINDKLKSNTKEEKQSHNMSLSLLMNLQYYHNRYQSDLLTLDGTPDFYLSSESIQIGKNLLSNWTLLSLMEIKLVNNKEVNLSFEQKNRLLEVLENVDKNDKIGQFLESKFAIDKIKAHLRYELLNHTIMTNETPTYKPKL